MHAVKIETAKELSRHLARGEPQAFEPGGNIENGLVNVYPQVHRQSVLGFGGAFTEAAAVTLGELSAANAQKVIDAYFGPGGIGYTFCRTPIHSCDFSPGNYTYAQRPDLSDFTVEHDKRALIPMIRAAQKAAGRPLKLLASPWSPPPFMKTNGEMDNGGRLRPECRAAWSRYIAKYIEAYRREEIDIFCVSVQNEPNACQVWESCLYTGREEAGLVRDCLGPEMERLGVRIVVWDHNKERVFERAGEILSDPDAARYVWGIGCHWYSGDHFEALSLTKEAFPDKELLFTEGCTENFFHGDELSSAERYAHDMLGDLNGGCSAFISWNLALNECGGPNHVSNFCAAPILCDTRNDAVHKLLPYYYIGQVTKFVPPDSVRVACSTYTSLLEVAAFLRPDGARAVLALNRSERAVPFALRENGEICRFTASPRSMNTVLYQ